MAYPTDSSRTKTWGTEVLTAADLQAQLDLLHNWVNAAMNGTTGHGHTGSTNDGKQISLTTAVTGTLPSTNGGTGTATVTQGDILYGSATNVWSKLGAGTSGMFLKTQGAGANPVWALPTSPYIRFSNTQAQNTSGGSATSGAWRTVPLNTENTDTDSIASIASNQMTLPAGTYRVHGVCPFRLTDRSQSRLQDITNTATLLVGSSNSTDNASGVTGNSIIMGVITLSGSTVIEMQYQVQTTANTSGLGLAGNFGTEVYAQIEFIKTA